MTSRLGEASTGVGTFAIREGTVNLNGQGSLGAGTGPLTLQPNAALVLDNTVTNVDSRLSGRQLQVYGGSVTLNGNIGSNTLEQTGLLTLSRGKTVFTLNPAAATSTTLTAGITTTVTRGGSTTALYRGTNLGNVAGPNTAVVSGASDDGFHAPPPPLTPTGASGDPNYGTCKQAIAAGKGPYVKDRDPEYAYYNDRDSVGIVCER